MTTPSSLIVYIIGDPSRGIADSLKAGWLASQKKEIVPAVYLRRGTEEWAARVDEQTFRARHGRAPLEGEMGCAAAHAFAYRKFLNTTAKWALIFESDVVVKDQIELEESVEAALTSALMDGNVISLYSEGSLFVKRLVRCRDLTRLVLRTPPHGAVAYLVDRLAAERLCQAQSRIASVADWPITSVGAEFSFVECKAIDHSSVLEQSTVSPGLDRSDLLSIRVRVAIWLGIWFLMYRRKFAGYPDYYRWALQPRLLRVLKRFSRAHR